MNVGTLISAAFRLAARRQTSLHKTWVGISFRIGSLLPNSLLLLSIQRVGELDVVLRCMEDELRDSMSRKSDEDFHFNYQVMLSEAWIGSVYEIVRLLLERKLLIESVELRALAHELRLLRIPLEKHEIAADRKIKEPLSMRSQPASHGATGEYIYSSLDPGRAHIMPGGVSERGSAMWQVIDVAANNVEFWLERRGLSERIVALWNAAPALPSGQ